MTRFGLTLPDSHQGLLHDPMEPVRERERERNPDAEVDELGYEPAGGDHRGSQSEGDRVGQVQRVADAADSRIGADSNEPLPGARNTSDATSRAAAIEYGR